MTVASAPRLVVLPHAGRAHAIWVYDVALDPSPAEEACRAAMLSRDERLRAERFRFARDRTRFVAGRAALRQILAGHGAGAAEDLAVVEGAWGKPALAHRSPLRFNVAHSGDRALVAVTREVEVGIDVERLRPLPDVDAIARRVCSAAERAALSELSAGRRDAAFLRAWVRKESCVKALGVGLHHSLAAVEVGIATGVDGAPTTVVVSASEERAAAEVAILDLDCGGDYVAALAVGPGLMAAAERARARRGTP